MNNKSIYFDFDTIAANIDRLEKDLNICCCVFEEYTYCDECNKQMICHQYNLFLNQFKDLKKAYRIYKFDYMED